MGAILNKLSTSKNMKIQIIKRLIRKIFIILFIVFSFILVFIGKPDNFIINKTSGVVADVMSPFVKIISYPIYIVGTFIEDVKNFRSVNAQNIELKQEVSKLKEQLNYLKQMEVENFIKSYLDIEKAETGGVATTDPRYDIEQVKENSYVPNEGVINSYEKRLKNYFGVSDKIIQNSFSEDEWNAFYEAEIEPIATELGDQLTYKLFTKHEIECGNEIVFEASSLACASMNTKLNLKEMVDRKSMTPNEWRKVMNLGSVDGGDVLLRRLDTGESETLQEKKEEKNENKE